MVDLLLVLSVEQTHFVVRLELYLLPEQKKHYLCLLLPTKEMLNTSMYRKAHNFLQNFKKKKLMENY